jgi:hypothetical protein
MTDQATEQEINAWHRRFAVLCNNQAWDLIEKPEHTAAECREMLYLAYASAYHWSKVGKPVHQARAEITLAHALSLIGKGDLAMQYAQSAMAFFETGSGEDWDLPFAHLEVALAAATTGDHEQHSRHYARAHALTESVEEEEDRAVLLQVLGRIPPP